MLAVLTLAGYAILDEQSLTVGMLFAFLSYRGYFSERMRSAVDMVVQVRTLRSHLTRLEDIWLTAPEPGWSGGQTDFDGTLSLRDIRFGYNQGSVPVLDKVELTIAAGEFVAIVGASGAGKSTLLRLLMGLEQPQQGQVLAGSVKLTPEAALKFRRVCGCVLQEDGFFAGSLMDNIALFDSVSEQHVWTVLERVGMERVVRDLPLGLRTQLGDIDSQLSSGQMQRLYLARAIFRQPRYLFLDEGTAHLDVTQARKIEDLVQALPMTRIVVTHSERFAERADRVIEMVDGHLVPYKNTEKVLSAG